MKIIKPSKIALLYPAFLYVSLSNAEDLVPSQAAAVSVIAPGFIELRAPSEIKINGELEKYEGVAYINVNNIDSVRGEDGISKGCTLAYSSEGYTQNIYISKLSCNAIMTIIAAAKTAN